MDLVMVMVMMDLVMDILITVTVTVVAMVAITAVGNSIKVIRMPMNVYVTELVPEQVELPVAQQEHQ